VIRLGTLFWLVLVSATGFAMFGVKYQVQALEDELARTKRATLAEEHEIRVLDAEWAYLTRPETLGEMNRRFLSLAPIATKQLHTTAADLPLRAPAPAPAPVETAVLAVAEALPPQTVPPQTVPPPPQTMLPVVSVQEKPAEALQLAKPVAGKAAGNATAPRRPKSLDDLIAQIMASR
jgi:hypothetical protein